MASIVAVALLWFAAQTAGAAARSSSIPTACVVRFENARDELIARGFTPTGDKDTRRWLRIDTGRSSVSLQLEMRTSADGAATSYTALVEHPRIGLEPTRWHLVRRKHCCDEHASREDRLFEHVWRRSASPLRAVVSVVEFEATMNTPDLVRWRDLFVEVARSAADDCMTARGLSGTRTAR